MNPFKIPGCTLVGYVRAENVNGGKPVPLFSPAPPKGRPDISTVEGWNAAADKQNRCSFRTVHGREPIHDDELSEWLYIQCHEQ